MPITIAGAASISGAKQLLEVMAKMAGVRPSTAGWLLKHGRPFEVRHEWPRSVPLKRGRLKECFETCAKAAIHNSRLIYCEGYGNGSICPVSHAWILDSETGIAYDPTWKDGEDYFGVPFDTDWLRHRLLSSGYYGILDTFGQPLPGDDAIKLPTIGSSPAST